MIKFYRNNIQKYIKIGIYEIGAIAIVAIAALLRLLLNKSGLARHR